MKNLIIFFLLLVSIGAYAQQGRLSNSSTGANIISKFNANFDTVVVHQSAIVDSFAAHRSAINANTAVMLRWDGGSTGLTAATGRTSLGGTTVGQNIFIMPNIGVVSFLRLNANNTVTARSLNDFKLDLNLQNVSNESKATMFTNPIFTGILPRLGSPVTDTIATRAYARSFGGGSGGSMTYPSNGIPLAVDGTWGASITNNSSNWNTAYSERLQWNGSSTGLNASTGRTSLSLQNVTNESKATMFTSPTFTGILPKYSTTDTLATRAYARLQGGGSGGGLTQPQVSGIVHDTIVARIGAGVNISTLLDAKQDVLSHPSVSGYVLSSTTEGSLSWIANGSGGSMTYPGAGIPISTGSAWGTSITNSSGNWNTAYTERLRWDGGATGLTASTGRNSLGATTIGSNIFTMANPGAIRFLRLNANNTISSLSAEDFRTAIGASGEGGGVTLGQVSGIVHDSIEALKTGAIQGVAVADSNQYKVGGYATPSFVDARIAASGGGADSSIYVTVTRLRNEIDYLAAIIEGYTGIDPGEAKYDRYVSNSGNDANDGLTPSTAWQTISKVNEAVFGPGATIHFRRGDEWREQLTINYSGSSTDQIAYTAYGTGAKPILNAANIVTNWRNTYANINANIWGATVLNPISTRTMVIIDDVMYNEVATLAELISPNLFWVNTASTPDSVYVYSPTNPASVTAELSAREYGIFSNKLYITISNLDIRNAGNKGIVFYGSGANVNGYTLIDSVNLYRNRLAGISLADGWSNSIIQNCTATYNGNNYLIWGTQAGVRGTGGAGSNNNIIRHCYSANAVHNWIVAGSHSDGTGYQIFNSNGCIIEHNESHNDDQGIYLDSWGNGVNVMTARYNKIYEANGTSASYAIGTNQSAAGDVHNIYYNLIVNCGNGPTDYAPLMFVSINEGIINCFNNTVYNDITQDIKFQVRALVGTNINLRNNIFSFSAIDNERYTNIRIQNAEFITSDYNHYHGRNIKGFMNYISTLYSVLATWTSLSSQDAHSQLGDPLFINEASDWRLQTGSPAINKGVAIPSIPQVDIDGNAITGLPNMGCYQGSTAPPAGVPAFLSDGNTYAWLKAEAEYMTTYESSTAITKWADASGNGNDFTTSSAYVYGSRIWDAANQEVDMIDTIVEARLQNSVSGDSLETLTIFMVVRINGYTDASVLMGLNHNPTAMITQMAANGMNLYAGNWAVGISNVGSGYGILTAIVNTTNSSLQWNNLTASTGNAGNIKFKEFSLGDFVNSTLSSFKEIIIRDNVATAQNIVDVKAYFNEKYGLGL